MEILTFSSSRFGSTSGLPSTSRSVSNLSLFPSSANPSPIRGQNDCCLRWASRKICTSGRWRQRESALYAKYRRTSYFTEAEEDKRRGMVGDEECPWEGAIMYKRSASHTHLEYCTTLERLGLSSLSSQLSMSTASQTGFRVTENGDSGTPVQISIDVTRKRRDLQLDGLLRTFITLPCYRCGEAAAKLVFSNFCLLLREDPIDEADEMDTTVGFGKDKAKTAYVSFDEEDHEEELDFDLDDQMYFPRGEKEIDISKYIRDIVHLENSMTALCDLNCKGSCVNCGTNFNKGTCKCTNTNEFIVDA
uniref:TSA: Wollemia nobilis Ref_Wollemi_Transcript_28736_1118 transcribed RNA sequence n=1 Tax=Wollemia nobilis TaxID=56998 RepID=A0A0C9RPP2_9CONI